MKKCRLCGEQLSKDYTSNIITLLGDCYQLCERCFDGAYLILRKHKKTNATKITCRKCGIKGYHSCVELTLDENIKFLFLEQSLIKKTILCDSCIDAMLSSCDIKII